MSTKSTRGPTSTELATWERIAREVKDGSLYAPHSRRELARAVLFLLPLHLEMTVMLRDYVCLHEQDTYSECVCEHCVGARAILAKLEEQ